MVVSHKRADREPDIGHAFLTSSVAAQPPFRWTRSDGVAGECPEWQRELTVNQPSYDFEGSSPSSPTTLRPDGLRVAQPSGDVSAKRVRRSLSLQRPSPIPSDLSLSGTDRRGSAACRTARARGSRSA